MTAEQANRLGKLVADGCVVKLDGPYLDSWANVYQKDGEWMIASRVWAEVKLITIHPSSVHVYRRVDFP